MTESEAILSIPLDDIEAPEGWNARSGAWHEDSADFASDDGGYEGLKVSMQSAGRNDEPVLLRPATPRDDGKFILVDGFRRYRVAKDLGWLKIRAVVEEMTEFEARRRNLQAQTGRIKHKPADLAWGLYELKKLGGPKMTDDMLGAVVGISNAYANILRRIMQDTDPRVTAAWRQSAVRVGVFDILKHVTPATTPEKQWEQWENLLLDNQTKPHHKSKLSILFNLESKARELGKTIGKLQRLGVIYPSTSGNFAPALTLITKRELRPDQVVELEKILVDGYHKGLEGKEPT